MIATLIRIFERPLGPTRQGAIPSLGLLVLRLVLGGAMLWLHGWPKVQGFAEQKDRFPDPLGVGSEVSLGLVVFAELVCAGLLVLGLFTRAAALPLAFTMGVAFFVIHGSDPLEQKELSLLYLAGYLGLFLLGAGRFSADSALLGRSPDR